MRQFIAKNLAKAAKWIAGKKSGTVHYSDFPTTNYIDQFRRVRAPTIRELMDELKNTAWTCASINAAVCASNPPKLYVRTHDGQPKARCQKKALHPTNPIQLAHKAQKVEEVLEHPLLELFKNVNPTHNSFDLWELTQLSLECTGRAFWLIEMGVLGIPKNIWILQAHKVIPRRETTSDKLVDFYEYHAEKGVEKFDPREIIYFRFPDPKDPYLGSISPLRACFEQVGLSSGYTALRRSVYDNTGIPSVLISPDEVIGEDEAARLEEQYNAKFRQGGMGKALVSESKMDIRVLQHSMGDLAALSENKATKEDIANAFHVPMPYLSSDTNLANMEAAEIMHMRLAIKPRLQRRDEKLNEQFIPVYDPTGRLFFASEDPTPANKDHLLKQQKLDLQMKVRSINEIRNERGYPPVAWGEMPDPTIPPPRSGAL